MSKVFDKITRPAFKLCFLVLATTILGCSTLKDFYGAVAQKLKPATKELAISGEDSKSPFTLAVVDELHDGQRLHIHAILTPKTDWPAEAVDAKLTGLFNGEIVTVETLNLMTLVVAELASKSLKARQRYDLVLSIPSNDITGYQIELMWGEGNSIATSGKDIPLELKDLQIEQRLRCDTQPCQIAFSLKGVLVNSGQNLINSAKLGLGFVFVPKGSKLDLSGAIPENEETVTIAGLNLASTQNKPFKLNIKSLVPERDDGAFMPVLRVLDFN